MSPLAGPSGRGAPGRRPPWWPEDEPWPPQRPPWQAWAGRRRHRGVGCLVAFVVVLGTAVIASSLVRPEGGAGWAAVMLESALVLFAVGLMVALGLVIVQAVVRWLAPNDATDQLIEAAGRVQDGDYSVRVSETGSPASRLLARSFNQMSGRLEATDAQRRSFMADVSHELRTPLAVIQGQLEAIRDGVYPADPEHIDPALQQIAVLERLVDDLRTLALTESGSLRLARGSVDLEALVTEVVGAFRAGAASAGVQLTATAEAGVPRAWVDPARIGSVVRNLVANALRYTPRGGSVTVRVGRSGAFVEVVVTDTGRGIDPALLPTVFERFSRSPDSSGSGLGLAIAKALVEAHGGTTEAVSEPGRGTTISVRLPLAEP